MKKVKKLLSLLLAITMLLSVISMTSITAIASVYPQSCGCDDWVDEDGDGWCDNCDWYIHEHDVIYEQFDETYHRLVCDICGKVLSEPEEHYDSNNDRFCDACGYEMYLPECNITILTTEDDSQMNHGYVTTDAETAEAYSMITVTVHPESGYLLDEITVSGSVEYSIWDGFNSDEYEFQLLEESVTVSATFRELTPEDCAAYLVPHTKNADGTAADTTRQTEGSYTYRYYDRFEETYEDFTYDYNGMKKVVEGETRYYYTTIDMAIEAAEAGKTNMNYASDDNKNGVVAASSGDGLYSGNEYLNPDLGDYTDTVVLLEDYCSSDSTPLYNYYDNDSLGTVESYNSHECKYGIHKGIVIDLNGHRVSTISGGLIADDETLVIKNGTVYGAFKNTAYDDESNVCQLTGNVVFSDLTMTGKIYASNHTFTLLNGLYNISFDVEESTSNINLRGGYYTGNLTTIELANLDGYHLETKENADETALAEFNAVGSAYGYRIVNGLVYPEAVKNATYSASLTLNKSIDINFKMKNLGTDGNGTGFDSGKLTITVDGENWTDYTVTNGTLSGVLKAVEPNNIGKDLHIVVTYDEVQVKNFTYSVVDYCEAVFNARENDGTGKYDALATLCEALLNYGKYAEDYVKGNTESTINEGHVIDFAKYDLGTISEGDSTGTTSFAGLSLGSTISLIFYVQTDKELTNDDPETQNFYVLNGNFQIDPSRVNVEKEEEDERYNYIVSIDLYASQLSTQYTLKLKGVDTSKFSVTYGVYSYCNAVQGMTGTATFKYLCKAIHNYGEAVDAYIESTK